MKPCKVCNEFHLGCEDWGCWKNAGGLGPARTGAASMVQDAIAKERAPKERKLNVVNLILGGALLVVIVALVLGVSYGY